MMRKIFTFLFLGFMVLNLAACNDVAIVHDLEERDANEILVILAKNDIKATKEKTEKNQEVKWFISVSPSDEMQARSLLVANNLPKIRHGGLSGICKDAGLILTPKTEKCREILAYKGEIINSLESIPGVVSADVVLNIPDKEEFPDENAPPPRPTASVTVQYLKDGSSATMLTEAKVQEFVSNSVSNLDVRDVAVIISYLDTGKKTDEVAEIPASTGVLVGSTQNIDGQPTTGAAQVEVIEADLKSVGGLKMDQSSARKFKVVAVLFLILFLLLTAAFIYVLLKMAKLKKQASVTATDATDDELADQKLLGT